MNGRCQCGAVRFVTPVVEPLKVYVCHCLECRWQASSSYGLSAMYPTFEFSEEAQKNMKIWSRTTFQGKRKDCYFCVHCGSRIVHHCPGQKLMTVKAGCLEGFTKQHLDNATHIWVKRAITPIPPGVQAFDEEPDDEDLWK